MENASNKPAKKEKKYWGVKESAIDKDLLKKIKKTNTLCNIFSVIFLICASIYMIFICIKNISDTAVVVFVSIYMVVTLAAIVVYIVCIVKLLKLKNKVLKIKKETETADPSKANHTEEPDLSKANQTEKTDLPKTN